MKNPFNSLFAYHAIPVTSATTTQKAGILDSELLQMPAYQFFSSVASPGFDAVFQFRSEVIQNQLVANLSKLRLRNFRSITPYDESALPEELRTLIQTKLLNLIASSQKATEDPVVSLRSASARTFSPANFEIFFQNPIIDTLLANPPSNLEEEENADNSSGPSYFARIIWDVNINLLVNVQKQQTPIGNISVSQTSVAIENTISATGSTSNAEESPSLGNVDYQIPSEPLEVYVPKQKRLFLTSGKAKFLAGQKLSINTNDFKTWIWLDFDRNSLSLVSKDNSFQSFLETGLSVYLEEAIGPLFGEDEIRITPKMSLGGSARDIAGLSGFQGTHKVMVDPDFETLPLVMTRSLIDDVAVQLPGTDEVLCIGMNVGEREIIGDIDKFPIILKDRNFAYQVSDKIFHAVIRSRWEKLSLPAGFIDKSPVEITDPESGESFSGEIEMRVTLQDTLGDISLVASDPGYRDALVIQCQQEGQLLRIWQNGSEITDELKNDDEAKALFEPAIANLGWRIQVFESPSEPETVASQFYLSKARFLLEPIYRPMMERLGIQNITGITSSPTGLIIVRSNLT